MKNLVPIVFACMLCSLCRPMAEDAWTYETYTSAMSASDRVLGRMSPQTFQAAQRNKANMLTSISAFLTRRLGSANPLVMKAFEEVPREYFMYNYQYNSNLGPSTYEVPARNYDIGFGSTISDYIVQAYMTQLLNPTPTDVSLEIGTGSGFQSAILGRIVKEAYSIEIITSLGEKVDKIFQPIGYGNIHTRVGDGFYGWPEVKGGFDIIMVTCQASFVPPELLAQLKPNGRMVIPIGQPWRRQFLYYFTKDADGKIHSKKEISVLFIPMTGKISK